MTRLYALAIALCFATGCCNHGDISERVQRLKVDLHKYQARVFADPYVCDAEYNHTLHLGRRCNEHLDWLETRLK